MFMYTKDQTGQGNMAICSRGIKAPGLRRFLGDLCIGNILYYGKILLFFLYIFAEILMIKIILELENKKYGEIEPSHS